MQCFREFSDGVLHLIDSCKGFYLMVNVFVAKLTGLIEKIRENPKFLLAAFWCICCVAYIPILFLNISPSRDVANRYAPMAEAFARGDFMFAFHPRCQVLHPAVSGIFAALGVDGFSACKMSSFLFFLLTVLPLFFLCKRVFGFAIAKGAVLLFAMASPLVYSLACSGLRDSVKMFVLLLISHAFVCIVQERDKLKWYIYAGISCGLAVCTRNDLVLTAIIVMFLLGVCDRSAHRWIWRSGVGVLAALAVSGLEVSVNYYVSNLVIPGSRYADIFVKVFDTKPTWGPVLMYAVLPGGVLYIAAVYVVSWIWSCRWGKRILLAAGGLAGCCLMYRVGTLAVADPENAWEYINAVAGGIFLIFFPLAVIGGCWRIKTHQWSKSETWLAILFLLFDALVLIQIILRYGYLYTSDRYMLPAIPLLMPWSWFGIVMLWNFLSGKLPLLKNKVIFSFLIACAILLSLYCSYRKEINNRVHARRINNTSAMLEIASAIKTEKQSFCKPKFNLMEYKSNVRPRVYFDCADRLTPAAYMGGGSQTDTPRNMDYFVTAANVQAKQIRKRFPYIRSLKKCGKEFVFRKGKLQIWKVTRK